MDINSLRKEIKFWLAQNVVGMKIYNKSIECYIILNRRGLMHGLSYSNENYVQKLMSLYSIEEIVKNAKLLRTEKDKKEREGIKEIIILETSISVESIEYDVKVVVRHTNEGRFYYDHSLIEKAEIKSM
jgi:hypothetical protein